MLESIYEINEKIESLTSMLDSVTESTSSGIKDSISSLYKEKYELILEEECKLEELFDSDMISEVLYNEYAKDLYEMEKETQEIACPYMTEAAGAITLTFIDRELEEIKNPDNKRLINPHWLKNRLSGYEKVADGIPPFSKLKSKRLSPEEAVKLTGSNLKPDEQKITGKSYSYKGKNIVAYAYCKNLSVLSTKMLDSSLTKHWMYYMLYLELKVRKDEDEIKDNANKFLKDYKALLTKKKSQLGKEVKESVLSTLEEDQCIDKIYDYIKESVNEGIIGEYMGKKYKAFVDMIYESTMLDHDNKNSEDW